eukprot:m.1664578 g.1664578  ORF g.1664578 m.1664578 type:complete len:55 (-) comp139527_c0_seq1:59-223(-)
MGIYVQCVQLQDSMYKKQEYPRVHTCLEYFCFFRWTVRQSKMWDDDEADITTFL